MRTDFMYAQPSLFSGVARLIDLYGTFDVYNMARTPREADAIAIYSDWRMIGEDLAGAMLHGAKDAGIVPKRLTPTSSRDSLAGVG